MTGTVAGAREEPTVSVSFSPCLLFEEQRVDALLVVRTSWGTISRVSRRRECVIAMSGASSRLACGPIASRRCPLFGALPSFPARYSYGRCRVSKLRVGFARAVVFSIWVGPSCGKGFCLGARGLFMFFGWRYCLISDERDVMRCRRGVYCTPHCCTSQGCCLSNYGLKNRLVSERVGVYILVRVCVIFSCFCASYLCVK